MQSSNESGHMTGESHLSLDRLAAFDDTPFTADEQAHLAACATCRAEYEAMLAMVGLAGALGHREPVTDAPRLVEFDHIMAGLRAAAGDVAAEVSRNERAVVSRPSSPSQGPARAATARRGVAPLLRQAAAAVLLVAGGAALGRMSGELGGVGDGSTVVRAASSATVSPASLSERPFADLSYGSVEQATIALTEAQREYERASLWLASNDTTIRDPEVFRARLAALDQMMEASRVALRDAPQDPVLNHYYLAAYSAREATLQALSSALPVDKIIERY